jgi:hypothetical protein
MTAGKDDLVYIEDMLSAIDKINRSGTSLLFVS